MNQEEPLAVERGLTVYPAPPQPAVIAAGVRFGAVALRWITG